MLPVAEDKVPTVIPARETRVVINCSCGRSHRLRNVEVYRKVIQAFIDGDLTLMTAKGIEQLCVMKVLSKFDEIKEGKNDE
jgi:hypothetical protein